MKKFAPVVAIAVLGMMFTSCKKDYTCTCKDNTGNAGTPIQYNDVKKSDAKKSCDALSSIALIGGGSCSLN